MADRVFGTLSGIGNRSSGETWDCCIVVARARGSCRQPKVTELSLVRTPVALALPGADSPSVSLCTATNCDRLASLPNAMCLLIFLPREQLGTFRGALRADPTGLALARPSMRRWCRRRSSLAALADRSLSPP